MTPGNKMYVVTCYVYERSTRRHYSDKQIGIFDTRQEAEDFGAMIRDIIDVMIGYNETLACEFTIDETTYWM